MKVLLVTGSFPSMKCGVGDYSSYLANALAQYSRNQVAVLTSNNREVVISSESYKVFAAIRSWKLIEVVAVIRVIREWSPDVIHIQYPTRGYGSGLLPLILPIVAFIMRATVVQTWHEGARLCHAPELLMKSIVPGGIIVVRPQYREKLPRVLRWMLGGKKLAFISSASAIPKAELDDSQRIILKNKYLKHQSRLIVFFGFLYPNKGIEQLFEIANPDIDQIVIAGDIDSSNGYQQTILRLSESGLWLGKVTFTGFLPANEIAELLSVADAVILPFRNGGGEWNTSIHGAVRNGALVITTSLTQSGYDRKRNVYYANVNNVQQIRLALSVYGGRRREYDAEVDRDEWQRIADEHCLFYESLSV